MSSSAEEATINPDGTTSFADDATNSGFDTEGTGFEDAQGSADSIVKGTDPAIFLALGFVLMVIIYYVLFTRNKKKQHEKPIFSEGQEKLWPHKAPIQQILILQFFDFCFCFY